MGTLDNSSGNPIVNSGLWAIEFGNSSANPNGLYFNAGINGGTDGLFGVIQVTPEPTCLSIMLGVLVLMGGPCGVEAEDRGCVKTPALTAQRWNGVAR